MKICLFCRHFYPHVGGNETQTMRLALQLIEMGHNVMVVTARIDKSYQKHETYKKIEIYRIRVYSISRIMSVLRQIINWSSQTANTSSHSTGGVSERESWFKTKIKNLNHLIEEYSYMWNSGRIMRRHRNEFDIIHSQMFLNYGYMAFRAGKKLGKPVLIKDASLGGIEKVHLAPRIERKRDLLRREGNFAAISSQIAAKFIEQGVSENRIFKITNGIDIEGIESRVNSPLDAVTLLYVGNFWQGEIKGLDVLLRAMGEVVKSHSEARLLIAGKGDVESYAQLAAQCGCLSNVEFLGQVKDMRELYARSSVFVLPSRQEGMSNATLEAMSYGMACVVTDVSGSGDQITSGLDGVIVPIEDHQAMAEAICKMIENPQKAKEMGLLAKQKIVAEFDIRVIASRIVDVYKQLIEIEK